MKSSNPVFKEKRYPVDGAMSNCMSVQGAINKTGILALILFVTAGWAWISQPTTEIPGYFWVALIVGFIVALCTIFNPRISPITSPIYAALEGLVLGAISIHYEATHPGIVAKAVMITFGILIAMLLVYKSRIIKVTNQFISGVVAATGGICIVYIANLVLSLFGINVPYIHEGGGWAGIGISLFVIGVASLTLILDFHNIEVMAERHAPKYMEWYGAFGIMVTMVWLYLEVLKLLWRNEE